MDVFTARLPMRSVQQSKTTAPVLCIYREPVNIGKPESLRNNFGIWDFNERHNKNICVPGDAGKVN